MKKLLVLLLILGMASTASAVLTAFEQGVQLTGSIPGTVNVFGFGFTVSEPGTVFVVFTGTVDTETLLAVTKTTVLYILFRIEVFLESSFFNCNSTSFIRVKHRIRSVWRQNSDTILFF